ncbi:MAG TPA: hypothetical protein VGK16_06835 [Candidatus Limnocylindrales bacterium]|jgi:hypothetical protein
MNDATAAIQRRGVVRVRLATAMAAIATACLLSALVLIALTGERASAVGSIRLGEALALVVPWLAFAIVGAIIVRHQPGNVVGWLCAIAGLQVSLVALSVGIATWQLARDPASPVGIAAAWLAHAGSITIVLAPLLILFRFPTGRSLGAWWRRFEASTIVVMVALVALFAIDPMPLLGFPGRHNPIGLGDTSRVGAPSLAPAVLCAALAVASLAVRFRRGSPLERRQVRLLALASVLIGLAMATMSITSPDLIRDGRLSSLTAVINAATFATIPLAIGVAILRDHLYDIDRIVNRTLVYGSVSGVLAAVYVATVVGISAVGHVVAPQAGNTVATAGSTLLVAALFRPVRARAQATIDRRFDRERYEARRTIDAFAGQVRDEVELGAIIADLRLATERTMRPSTTACWIRGPLDR